MTVAHDPALSGTSRASLNAVIRTLGRLAYEAEADGRGDASSVGLGGWFREADWLASPVERGKALRLIREDKAVLAIGEARADMLENLVLDDDHARAEQLDPKGLERYLRSHFPDGAGAVVDSFVQVAGGRSKQTALVVQHGWDALPHEFVVRRDHPVAFNQSVRIEYPVIAAAHAHGVSVPRPILLEPEGQEMGGPFMLMSRVDGKTAADFWDPPQEPELATDLARELARLHSIDWRPLAAGLNATVSPDKQDGWIADHAPLADMAAQFFGEPPAAISAGLGLMRQLAPRLSMRTSIVHGDANFHNVLVRDGRLVALLDWETSHIGHPGEDLGYVRPFVEQIIPWDRFMAAYRAAGGPEVSTAEVDYFTLRQHILTATLLRSAGQRFERGEVSAALFAEVGTDFVCRFTYCVAQAAERITASEP